jgi:hypothetical protein
MRRKKRSMSDAESDRLFRLAHPDDGMTTEQLMDAVLETVRAMDADQKAHLRAKMNRRVGIAPKTSGGKPS